jgi:hypothetical protein
MALLPPEIFELVLPLAVKWAEDYEKFILNNGISLSPDQKIDAKSVGVKHPEKIKILQVIHIPQPNDGLLKVANDTLQFITQQTLGLTLRYGIFIQKDSYKERKLLIHEFVHTSQYERLGSIESFLRRYLHERTIFEYSEAPLELEAIQKTEKICS